MVERRTENPCVASSILALGTSQKKSNIICVDFFVTNRRRPGQFPPSSDFGGPRGVAILAFEKIF